MFRWIKDFIKEVIKECFGPRRKVCGEITLCPGEGNLRIDPGFRPRDAWIDFIDCPQPVPGCSQLEDKVRVTFTVPDGFFIYYKIQTGIRKAKWCALK